MILSFEKPHFRVKVHSDTIEVDLNEGARKELERLAEARPFLQDSLGWLLQTLIPLDVKLSQIDKVEADTTGKVHIAVPYRRDIHIPLDPSESQQLVEKLNELIPAEKERARERERILQQVEREREQYKAEDLKYVRRGP